MRQSSAQFERANVQYVMLRHCVSQAMDTTGWGTIIIMLDVVLSLLSVVSYIVTTYGLLLRVRAAMQVLSSVGMRPLRVLQVACQCRTLTLC